MRKAMQNFHVPLPARLYAGLRREAEREGRAATELAREAIEAMMRRRQRLMLAESIAEYAAKRAGTADDLDPALEHAGVEHLLSDEDDR